MVRAGKLTTGKQRRHFSKCLFFGVFLVLPPAGTILADQPVAGATSRDSAACLNGLPAEKGRVARVTDGDTIVLADDRRVRLIGLNTLELDSADPQDRAMAVQAREALIALLANRSIQLIPGRDTTDRHGRTLAHVRLADGRDAAQTLVSLGLGLAVAVGANTRCANTLMTLERQARNSGLGLWQVPGRWYLDTSLRGTERGFHLASGRVRQIRGHGGNTTLLLDNGLQVRLGRHWPGAGDQDAEVISNLLGQKIQVRGWFGTSAGRPSLILHHPANLERLTKH